MLGLAHGARDAVIGAILGALLAVACGGSTFEPAGTGAAAGRSGSGGSTGGKSGSSSGGSGGSSASAGASGSGGKSGNGGSTGGSGGSFGGSGGTSTTGGTSGGGGSSGSDAGGGTGGTAGCLSNADCAAIEFCAFQTVECGIGSHAGTCQPRPTGCDTIYQPVCGCDGKLYPNLCTAQANGVDVSPDGSMCGRCPTDVPTNGGSCTVIGLSCTYGSSVRSECRTQVRCDPSGWTVQQVACSTGSNCPLTQPQNSPTCTTTGLVCEYSPSFCTCTNCTTLCGGTAYWRCASPPAAPCPSIPPNIGQACDSINLSCSYGTCASGSAIVAVCSDTLVWQWQQVACPL